MIEIELQLEQKVLNFYLKMESFQFVYNHEEIFDWWTNNIIATNASSQTKPLSLILPSPKALEKRRFSFGPSKDRDFSWLMRQIVVKCSAELWNVSMLTKLQNRTAALCVCHTKVLLEQFDEKRSNLYENKFLKLLLNNRHWSLELMTDSLWWSLDNATRDQHVREKHTRGTPFFVDVCLVKLSSYGNATKLDLSVRKLRFEYSQCLAEFILKSKECICQYGGAYTTSTKSPSKPLARVDETSKLIPKLLINAKIEDITTFLFTNHAACILIRLSEATLARTQQITVLAVEEFHMAVQNNVAYETNAYVNLTDLIDFINIKMLRIEYLMKPRPNLPTLKQFNVHIIHDSMAMWCANLHMQWLTLIRDMIAFKQTLLPTAATSTTPNTSDDEKSLSRTVFEICAANNFEFGIKLSERHTMNIFFENFLWSRKDQTHISVEKVFVNIDDAHIFTFKDFTMQSADSVDFVQEERKHYENFALATNRVWITNIGTFKAIFPYIHDFAEAIQNEFNSLVKWLKLTHNRRSEPFTSNSPLPSDMLIQIKEFLMEMCDDPFEVKLRDNYELLVDEYHESMRRKQLLEKKIQEKCADRLLLPAETLTILHATLEKQNSDVYIRRSKKHKEARPIRTRLFAWILNDLEIMAMADPTLHGTDNVTRIICDIDAESPWPEEGMQFVTLWCRAVNVSCTEWKFMLRQVTITFLRVPSANCFFFLTPVEISRSQCFT